MSDFYEQFYYYLNNDSKEIIIKSLEEYQKKIIEEKTIDTEETLKKIDNTLKLFKGR